MSKIIKKHIGRFCLGDFFNKIQIEILYKYVHMIFAISGKLTRYDPGPKRKMKAKSSLKKEATAPPSTPAYDTSIIYKVPASMSANPWSSVFVTWITPLLKLGSKRPLDTTDLAPILPSFEAAPLTQKLSTAWESTTAKSKSKNNNKTTSNSSDSLLLKTLFSVFGATFIIGGCFLIGEFTNLIPPLMLESLIEFQGSKREIVPPFFNGYVSTENYFIFASIVMFVFQLVSTVLLNTYFMVIRYLGIKIRTSVSGLIYQKSLRLSCAARQVI